MASVPFEQFHKFSADIITAAVFGKTADGIVKSELLFKANNLVSDWMGVINAFGQFKEVLSISRHGQLRQLLS